MLDETKPRDRIVAAALRLAAERPWREVGLFDIADKAGTDLAGLRREFGSKGAILAAFTRAVDDAVLTRAAKPAADQAVRDRLFDVVMTRFDVLGPYKAGLKSIAAAGPADMELCRKFMASQAWMLNAAGIATDGPLGPVRVAGLGSVYARVFRTWLDDDDPGLARTMAALDRRLKRGEEAMRTLDGVCGCLRRLACAFVPGSRRDGGGKTGTDAPGEAGTMGYGRA